MARFFPDSLSDGATKSELAFFDALHALSDSWAVYPQVTWSVPKHKGRFYGETDFVLVHPKRGMLVVEVKGAGVYLEAGQWWRTQPGGGRSLLGQSPFEQVKGAMFDVGKQLAAADPGLAGVPAGHGVAFPFASQVGDIGLAASEEMVLSGDDLLDTPSAIERLADFAGLQADLGPHHLDGITKLLAPTRQFRRRLSTVTAEIEAELVKLTDQQALVLNALRRNRRAVIYGGAGTGKTVLAIERARRLAAEGYRVLLTCYNRPLGDHLALELEEHEGAITAKSFHALGLWLVASSGAEVPANPDTAWFETRLPELLPSAAKDVGFEVDVVVVDEGQDFHSEWFLALQLLCADADTAPFYVFTDPNQTIYNGTWEPPFIEPAFDLDVNCRNTNQIAAKVSAILGQSGPTLGVDGPEPSFVTVAADEDRIPTVLEILKNMLHLEGLRPEQLTVLSRRRATADDLRGSTVAGQLLEKPGGKGIAVDTVHRFKGLESDVVVATMPELANENDKRLAYIALSRAKSFLVVVGTEAVKAQLAW